MRKMLVYFVRNLQLRCSTYRLDFYSFEIKFESIVEITTWVGSAPFRASLTSYTLKRFYFVPTHIRSASSRSHSYPVRPRAQYDLPFTEIYERDFNNLLSGDVRRPFESVWEPRLSRRGNKNELITELDLVSLVIQSENTKKVILT